MNTSEECLLIAAMNGNLSEVRRRVDQMDQTEKGEMLTAFQMIESAIAVAA